ncbi:MULTISPECIES: ABC transporter permease [Comamonas]|jgi:peptide/nickel transport system permease protein|uniref:ABC transporter permease n=1 Tax=Comamonas terrigena TaxID=32013 RepID=A0A2A7UQP5_COMTR|nr:MULTISPECIES: ABC transporter permease [Comamonas]MBD9532814.1 ABC transporter permease [Comamonas sp. CMM01]PEH87645.1 ABC transporter permease [Comamonas terrigena]BBL26662.1 ABC transporter permease [Comamonas terrigena NBRC 13299]SUY92542.1 Glutathione transport system permease protein gsiC [Comamonas terrigena]
MLAYLLRRILYTLPIMLGVALLCFALVHLAPGDPLVSVLPADASAELQAQMRELYGFNRPLPEQFARWVWRALQGDLGQSIATSRPVASEVMTAVINTLRLAVVATLIGFVLGSLFGFVAGYFRNSWVDRACSMLSVLGVSVPHYWLGMVMVIIFSSQLMWLPATGAGPGGSGDWAWDREHVQFMILPAITMSVIPLGIIARTVRALVAELLDQEFILGLKAKGLTHVGIFRHVLKNAAPTALAVMGLQLGYLLGGSILIETVFSWPGTGFLLNQAIFQRDLPLLQGSILVLAVFFVLLNLIVDVVQTLLDPRIAR